MVEADARGHVSLATSDGEIRLKGPVARELSSVPGALAKVWGSGGASSLRVQLYQLIDVGKGFSGYVGWIVIDQMGIWLAEWRTGRSWGLAGIDPAEFRELHGVKVWMTGLEEGGDSIRPLDWGVLEAARCPAGEGRDPGLPVLESPSAPADDGGARWQRSDERS